MKKFVKSWTQGLGNTLQFWDPKKVKKGFKQQWERDPIGKRLNNLFFPEVSSAKSLTSNTSSDVYGVNGSIVGRY